MHILLRRVCPACYISCTHFQAHIYMSPFFVEKDLFYNPIIIKSTKKRENTTFTCTLQCTDQKNTVLLFFVYNIPSSIYHCNLSLYISEIDIPYAPYPYCTLLYTVSTLLFVCYKIFVIFTFWKFLAQFMKPGKKPAHFVGIDMTLAAAVT